jgi:DNA recombination protein RmuC
MSSPVIFLVVGIIFALGLICLFVMRARPATADNREQAEARLRTQLSVFEERLAGRDRQIEDRNQAIAELEAEESKLRQSLADALAANSVLEERLANQMAALRDAKTEMKADFAITAKEVLKESGNTFLELAAEKLRGQSAIATGELETKKAEIDGLIGPMKTTLTALDENVRSLKQSENSLLIETRELATALKDSKRRGNWGELQLRRIAELAGMQERCDFTLQEGLITNENRRLYPDMTARLPNNRVVVVDSKASMVAYGEAANSTDPQIQKQKLIDHAKAVRKRVDELVLKEYRAHVDGSADFVVCFIPGEAFFSAAIATDPDLLEYAAERNVILASPTTLLTLLRAVALGWKEAKLADDAKHICTLGLELYDRLRSSINHIAEVGERLESAVGAYDAFIGSMEKRVFPQARRFRTLVASDKELANPKSAEIKVRKPITSDWIPDGFLSISHLAAEDGEQGHLSLVAAETAEPEE